MPCSLRLTCSPSSPTLPIDPVLSSFHNVTANELAATDALARTRNQDYQERLWRTVKYEYVYLTDHQNGVELEHGLTTYFRFYNTEASSSFGVSDARGCTFWQNANGLINT